MCFLRPFKLCLIITMLRVSHLFQVGDPDLISKSQVCQNHKLHFFFFLRFLSTVVQTEHGCYTY